LPAYALPDSAAEEYILSPVRKHGFVIRSTLGRSRVLLLARARLAYDPTELDGAVVIALMFWLWWNDYQGIVIAIICTILFVLVIGWRKRR
jgi:hypothetical protein